MKLLLIKLLGRESKAPPLGTPPDATEEVVPPLFGNKSPTPSFSVEVENDIRLIGDFERICALVITNVGENELSDCLVQIERFDPKQSELAIPFVLRTAGQLEGDRSGRFSLSVSQPKNVPLLFRRSTRHVDWYLIDENGKSHFISPSDMRLDVAVYDGRNNAKFPVTIRLVSDWDARAKIEEDSRHERTKGDEAVWESIELQGVYYAWAGGLLDLQDRDAVSPPIGLLDEMRKRGLTPYWANKDRIAHHVEQGLVEVFATDQKSWRRHVMDNRQTLMVRIPHE